VADFIGEVVQRDAQGFCNQLQHARIPPSLVFGRILVGDKLGSLRSQIKSEESPMIL
jgi:hypothetical protein